MTQTVTTRRGFVKAATVLAAPIGLSDAHATNDQGTGNDKGYVLSVREFGAKGDGHSIDSPAINQTIEKAASSGGGTVYFPPGTYLSYSIRLKSNLRIFLAPGATIVAADTPDQPGQGYDLAESNKPWEDYQDYHHNHWHNSLLWGEGLDNVEIAGPGLFWGRGLSRGDRENRPFAEDPGVGSRIIGLKNCRNVQLRDFSILKGGTMGILATGVDNLLIDSLRIDTNRDGMDVDCCKNVHISNCAVNSPWDDAICLKSSYALGYARPTENVMITNCYVTGAYQLGTMLDGTWKKWPADHRPPQHGRIKFGTESNGGFINTTVSNCVFEGCRGFALESVDGARLEDMVITGISMRDLIASPIFIRLGARMRGPQDARIGKIRRVLISDVVVSNNNPAFSSIITGIPGACVEDLKIRNVFVEHQGGGTKEMSLIKLAENEKDYPEHSMFGNAIPAQGFYLRHVKNVEMSDIEIRSASPDLRPAFLLDDVSGADFWHVKANLSKETPMFDLTSVSDFAVVRSQPISDKQIAHVGEHINI